MFVIKNNAARFIFTGKLFFCLEEKVGLAAIAEYDNQEGGHNLRRGRVPAE